MAQRLDVAARLAEGQPAVEHTQTYVGACRVLGYQHPDLTAHDSQVRDWYETEAGLDLRVLDDDCAALWAAVNATEEALALQRAQITELAAAWRGPGADSATQFLQRHCDAGAAVAARVRAAAQRCGTLRDNLWQLIDSKVATAIAVDDRTLAQRSAWLAAAHTVTTGAGDRSVAEELVRQQLTPYVDNDIRNDWLTAMRLTADSVRASYDATTDALAAAPDVCFEIPGDLGPREHQPNCADTAVSYVTRRGGVQNRTVAGPFPGEPPPYEPVDDAAAVASPAAPAPSSPAGAAAQDPLAPMPSMAPTLPAGMLDDLPPAPPFSELTAPLGDAAGMSTGTGNLGGVGGVVGKIIDGIGGLLGSLAEGLADPSALDDPPFDDALDADDPIDDETDEVDDPDGKEAELTDANENVEDQEEDDNTTASDEKPSATGDAVDEPVAPSPADVPPPVAPAPPAAQPEAQPEESTPCEIAADELPQAGQ